MSLDAAVTLPQNAIVWNEIPVPDLDAAIPFYEALTGFPPVLVENAPFPHAVLGYDRETEGVSGFLRPGTPAAPGTGPILHLRVAGTVEKAAARCRAAGGKVLGDPVTIPAGTYVYAQDPWGNSIGLFTPAA